MRLWWWALGRALLGLMRVLRPEPVDPVEDAKARWAADADSTLADLDWTLDRLLGRTQPHGTDWTAFFLA